MLLEIVKIIGIILGAILGLVILAFIGIVLFSIINPEGANKLAAALEQKSKELQRQVEEHEKRKGDK